MTLERGAVALVDLNPVRGHGQRGVRPAVIVSDAGALTSQRFPLVCVVPVSGKAGEGALYPVLQPGPSGLLKRSCALIDQIRSVDKRRILRIFGTVAEHDMRAIDTGLALFLGLD